MTNPESTVVEVIKIITGFLSDNSWQILIFLILIICRDAISNLIERMTNFSWKSGDSEIGVEAVHPNKSSTLNSGLDKATEQPKKLTEEQDLVTKEEEVNDQNWFSKMYHAFEESRINDAEAAFKKYSIEENEPTKLEQNKAIYLYYLYMKGKDNSAINQLENLVNSATNEESKYRILEWLSLCYIGSSQLKSEMELWEKAIGSFQSGKYVTSATVNLAKSLIADGKPTEARTLLMSRLQDVTSKDDKSILFSALSDVEKELGKKIMSVYCKDKSLEFDPDNRDELFNSAYQASEEKINELSISNYVTLLRLDPNNSAALNNLGVRAQELNLKIKAVEKYKASSNLNHTLAMANQGYMLLDAGFVKESEEIAKKAVQMDEPHENVYILLGRLAELQKEQDSKWEEIVNSAKSRQKFIRNYTNAYYFKTDKTFEGEWLTENSINISINIKDKKLEASWKEPAGGLSNDLYLVKLSGLITNSSFKGKYKKTKEGGEEHGFLGLSLKADSECMGYLSDDHETISLVAEDADKKFKMLLRRKCDKQKN